MSMLPHIILKKKKKIHIRVYVFSDYTYSITVTARVTSFFSPPLTNNSDLLTDRQPQIMSTKYTVQYM